MLGAVGVAAPDEEGIRLVDGRSVAVRCTRPEDAEAIARLFAGLSRRSMAMRFGYGRRGLSPAEADAMAAPPGPGGLGLVALAGGETEEVVALARYESGPEAREAELAVAVADTWQGLGVGTALVELLLRRAAADDLDALWAVVRPENQPMLEVFRTLGTECRVMRTADEVLVRLGTGADDALEEASAARFVRAAAASLSPLFHPRAIAVVGASRDAAAPGGAVFRALLASGFRGPVFAVNHRATEVAGRRAYPALALVPEPADLVVVALPAPSVPAAARDAAAHGARALVVLSSGFAEDGLEGAALQAELLHIARTSGLRVVGPNCLGLAVNGSDCVFDASFGPAAPAPGRMAFASQSGGLGIAALTACAERGIGMSAFVSLGNKADVSSNDLLAWWERDEATRVVLLYLEGFGNPRRFARVARRVARGTPIVALTGGRGAAGRRAAGSHTAALAAGEVSTDALLALAGVVRVGTMEELLAAGEVMASQPLPAGDRVAVVANAAGPAILATDASETQGLSVPELPAALRARLGAAGAVATANPVDLGAGAGPERFLGAVRAIDESGAADALIVIHAPTRGADPDGVARAVQSAATGRTAVVGCLLGQQRQADGDAAWPVPWLRFPEEAARALGAAVQAADAARRPDDPPRPLPGTDRLLARRALESAEPGAWLAPHALESLLRAYGIPVAASRLVRSPEEAAAAQADIGAPVAVKVTGQGLVHKRDVGGVVLGCASPESAADAYRAIEAALAGAGRPGAMEGAMVQPMAGDGLDLIVGATVDPVVGPLVLAGIGGTEAELWGDRAVALAPVGPRTAEALWGRLRGAPLLDGYRGGPTADRSALAGIVERIGSLAAEQPLLAELDCNPVRVPADGAPIVVDARARRASRGPAGS
jgi:acyl-CoA synthetase (NDP forming)/GNAT superfamily N-acetyltransferase